MDEQEKTVEQEAPAETLEVVEEAPALEEAEALEVPAEAEELSAERQELEAQRAELERQWDSLRRERRLDRLGRELEKRGMSGGFAGFLMRDSDEESMEQLDRFEAVFRESLGRAVTERMRGGLPPREPTPPTGYRRDDLHGLSRREINAHWEEVMRSLAE